MNNRFTTFTALILDINRSICKIKNIEMNNFGLKGTQVHCMYHLYYNREEGLGSKELTELCNEDKAVTSRNIKQLTDLGYVFVEKQSSKKYKNPVKLTPLGEKIGVEIASIIDKMLTEASSGIEEKDRDKFYTQLTSVRDRLRNICEKY